MIDLRDSAPTVTHRREGMNEIVTVDCALADQQGLAPAHQEEQQRRHAVQEPDSLVIGGRHPRPDALAPVMGRRRRLDGRVQGRHLGASLVVT